MGPNNNRNFGAGQTEHMKFRAYYILSIINNNLHSKSHTVLKYSQIFIK